MVNSVSIVYVLRKNKESDKSVYSVMKSVNEYFQTSMLFSTYHSFTMYQYYNEQELPFDELIPLLIEKYNPKLIVTGYEIIKEDIDNITDIIESNDIFLISLADYNSREAICNSHVIRFGSSYFQITHTIINYHIMNTNNFAIFGYNDREFNIINEEFNNHKSLYPFLNITKFVYNNENEIDELSNTYLNSLNLDTVIIIILTLHDTNTFMKYYEESSIEILYPVLSDILFRKFTISKPIYKVNNYFPIPEDSKSKIEEADNAAYIYTIDDYFYKENIFLHKIIVFNYIFTRTLLQYEEITLDTFLRTVVNGTNENSVGNFGYLLSNLFVKNSYIYKIYSLCNTTILYINSHQSYPTYPYPLPDYPLYVCNIRRNIEYYINQFKTVLYLDDFNGDFNRTIGVLNVEKLYSSFTSEYNNYKNVIVYI